MRSADRKDEADGRYHLIFWLMVFFFVILGARLWYLQVVRGAEFYERVESNRTRTVELTPARGLILDRNGTVLVDNEGSFDLCVQKSRVKDAEKLLEELAGITGVDVEELRRRYQAIRSSNAVAPLVQALSRKDLVTLESRRYRLEGTSIRVNSHRHPIIDVLASHTLGYVREISREQLEDERQKIEEAVTGLVLEGRNPEEAREQALREMNPHSSGDLVGRSGLEQTMEQYLHGRPGLAEREVNARETVLSEVIQKYPEPGYSLRLTLDARLQAVAQSLLGERAGAIVLLDPRNFEILALASSPTFRLSDFSGGISTRKWQNLLKDPFTPLLHRAIAGQYPPGSTYKIAVALAALAEGIITPDTTFQCNGSITVGPDTFRCHNHYGHGKVDLEKSLAVSCDVYYYEVGRLMGIDLMSQRAGEYFGLGRNLGLELNSEQGGVLPTTEWKMRRENRRWTLGDTITASIGQGYVAATPLQVAQMTAVAANGGSLYRPHLVKEVVDIDGQVVHSFEPELISTVDIPREHFVEIRKGLEAVVNDPDGTGRRAALPDVTVAGKTGTSQVISNRMAAMYGRDKIPYHRRDHAWFTGYAPAENPEVVVVVLLEHAGGGGAEAAPVGGRMLAAYFDPRIMTSTLPPAQAQPDKPTAWQAALE
ncbi:MAG: penicillin-binding protein 2 [Candidatus Adiutrix sp.]|jgi:penicillin-binding protein 2|nr:penicillin-binding protein 2 [Candidatus Adiutrix sp.]